MGRTRFPIRKRDSRFRTPRKGTIDSPSLNFDVSWTAAFLAGLASFLSPCVLPLAPAYLSVLAGGAPDTVKRGKLILSGLLFVAGFSAVFIAMGMSASASGQWIRGNREVLRIVSGIFVILMGILMMELFSIPALSRTFRFDLAAIAKKAGNHIWGPPLIGMGFAVGWTPCVGPALTGALFMAANGQTLAHGAALLAVYSIGMGLPFILLAAFAGFFLPLVKKLGKWLIWIRRAAGVMLIVLGALIWAGRI